MTTPRSPQAVPASYSYVSPSIEPSHRVVFGGRAVRRLFTKRADCSPEAAAAGVYAPMRPANEMQLQFDSLQFLVRETNRLRARLINAALELDSSIAALEQRCMMFEVAEMTRRYDEQRRDDLHPSSKPQETLSPWQLSPIQKVAAAPVAPAAPAVASETNNDDIYEL
jgi:hypothetical protein